MLAPIEIVAILVVVILTIGGIFVSVEDAAQLGRALNLNLTQTIILNQGIVNLQRDVQLTHNEVTRLLGALDIAPRPITRFAFVEIQVKNLATEVEAPTRGYVFADEDLGLVEDIEAQSAEIKQLINTFELAGAQAQHTATLKTIDEQLNNMEFTIKELGDRQAILKKEEKI